MRQGVGDTSDQVESRELSRRSPPRLEFKKQDQYILNSENTATPNGNQEILVSITPRLLGAIVPLLDYHDATMTRRTPPTRRTKSNDLTPPASAGYRITKVYTRQGDGGTTRLVGGHVVPKSHPRLAAYGTVDELQVAVGAAIDAVAPLAVPAADQRVQNGDRHGRPSGSGIDGPKDGPTEPVPVLPLAASLRAHLLYLQNRLFTLGGELATRLEDRWEGMPQVAAADVAAMERLIDALNDPLPPLKDFVLPGGHPAVTALHQARVVCRRAEREVETLAQSEALGPQVRPFLNRLSDLLFVMARALAQGLRRQGLAGEEAIWRREMPYPPLPK